MKKLIAIPSSNGLLDEHFGHCRQFALLSVEDNKIESKSLIDAPPHEPGLLPKYLAEKGVTDVIAGGMGNRAIQLFNQHNVNVFVGAPKLSPEEITEGFLNKTLQFSTNYCDH
ncbi:MAG: NifB/NifX family molybdenum-iron cluster-binding protein [Bacteroidales bacterium]|nr:NifB/NifX family molybdenum-iron cluster-binding protein [Bacteroidales bacterium]